jgi:hypothetical protein
MPTDHRVALVDPRLLSAYSETEYRVVGSLSFVLRIGYTSEPLARAHAEQQVTCSAYITACNPHSASRSDADNHRRQQALAAELTRRGLVFLPGVGQHPTNGWPGEASYLVFGLSLEEAMALGREWEQNAIVWAGADAIPQLVLLR